MAVEGSSKLTEGLGEREHLPAVAEIRRQGRKVGREGDFCRRQWKVAVVLLVAGLFGAAFVVTPPLDAPTWLWNNSPSMDSGIYRKVSATPAIGSIVSVEIPDAARLYAQRHGMEIGWGSFLKPVAAVSGDLVCVSLDTGLAINGQKVAEVRHHDTGGNVIAVWSQCRELLENEFFLYAPRVPESYDSRYYGPVRGETVKGVYEPLWTW